MLDTATTNHQHSHATNRFSVIPTAEKLDADTRYAGNGVRIAFLDSGFYPHPDFATRIVEFHDIAGEETSLDRLLTPQAHHWHGTQTVTACAGDGTLSDGHYRGIAYQVELVLVKVSRGGRVGDTEIEAGLRWVSENRERLSIRVLNISLGGDCDRPSAASAINSLVEELTSSGVVVIVAAGNSAEAHSLPPASAASALTVGGYSDSNDLLNGSPTLYHSNNGPTADGLLKPEIIAPAMFVAAPILPGTADYAAAETLSMLATAADYAFGPLLDENWRASGLDPDILNVDRDSARQLVDYAIRRRKVVATHYRHVDGTSFAAPIVASVVAQMLEANPDLTPAAIKNILVSSAIRLAGQSATRQGFGTIDAPRAVAMARNETHLLGSAELHPPKLFGKKLIFRFHDDAAASVSLAGDFNGWMPVTASRRTNGVWETVIDSQPNGTYRYKFVVDGVRWIEDPSHAMKEEDGLGGFNSVLVIG